MEKVYTPTIGLEIHAELNTNSKMFCGCKNNPDAKEPNVHVCPVCTAHPGTLPVINKEAVKQVLRVGTAVGGTIATFTEFDRKNYFYPDIPKNYQISQYKYPLISGGEIAGIELTRIHLEEDTARSMHDTEGSNVDYNRAGVPLMELVTEPVIKDHKTAVFFARELKLLLQYLGAGEANLEKGEMRIEANISVSSTDTFGTKVEIKNLNSFKAVEQSIQYEIQRQTELLKKGNEVAQETRGWDENKQKTFSQRMKEESHDYRYYPDPDLPKLYLDEVKDFNVDVLKKSLPTLPWEMRAIYKEKGMKDQTVELLIGNTELNSLYQEVCKKLKDENERSLAANYLTSDVLGILSKNEGNEMVEIVNMNADEFASLIQLVSSNTISSRGAKDVLQKWVTDGGNPLDIAKKLNILQISDPKELVDTIEKILSEHESVVDDYKQGKEAALQFLVGQGMKATRGAANPEVLRELILKTIGK